MTVEDITTKRCTKCGDTKPLTNFPKDRRSSDGFRHHCKCCVNADNAAWRAANPEKARASTAAWATANPERDKSRIAAWCAANRDKRIAATAAWRIANIEKHRSYDAAYKSAWRKSNPEASRIQCQNIRARRKASGGKLSHGLAEKLYKLQRGKCACCSQPLGTDYHLDHIMPLKLGGTNTDDNMQLLRAKCNMQKNAKHPVDFMQQRGFLL